MYKAIVIGAGSIGALKPDVYDSPTTENILTHAHMCHANPEIELFAIIDSKGIQNYTACNKWNCFSYLQIPEFFPENIDIISVCTPTETHKNILLEIIRIKPKLVIAEKPFCSNSKEAEEVIEAYKQAEIPIIVNYSRRFVPEIQRLKRQLQEENFGKIYSATFHYTRGFVHEGCHAIDLCRFLFGEFCIGQIGGYGFSDRDKNDMTVGGWLGFEKCPHVFLSPCDGREYKVFQLEIMTEAGKIILSQHGVYIDFYGLEKEPIWGGFDILSKNLEFRMSTSLNKSLLYLGNEIVNYLKNRLEKFSCTVNDALQVHKIIEHLKGE